MKKNLIFLSMALLCAICAFAITDGQTYQPVNDYNLVNKWIFDRVHTTDFLLTIPHAIRVHALL